MHLIKEKCIGWQILFQANLKSSIKLATQKSRNECPLTVPAEGLTIWDSTFERSGSFLYLAKSFDGTPL